MKKIIKIIGIAIPLVMISLVIIGITALYFTPKPIFSLVNMIPIETNFTKPTNFINIEKEVSVSRNIPYSQNNMNGTLDIYKPKNVKSDSLPVILFIHGGGFFQGEKEMAQYFGPSLVNGEYAFISIDYDLAPNVTIFDQIIQVNEAVNFIEKEGGTYGLDSKSINLTGSSAGGFLALQLLSAYYDASYAQSIGITPIDSVKIKSLLLYSAVYDLSTFQKLDGNLLSNYALSKVGWGLTGEKNWQDDKRLGTLLNLNNYIKADFPPIFITDGNSKTFTHQGKAYEAALKAKHVPTQSLFFDDNEKVGHGYQLNMSTNASEKAVTTSLRFLDEVNKN